jgi:hypothetical protein
VAGEEASLALAQRLVGQHPAALRSVHWCTAEAGTRLRHLEVETKHGQVVVFDHRQPLVYSQPPRPTGTQQPRRWRDLTEEARVAFDDRPVITQVEFIDSPAHWQLRFSTGARLSFMLDGSTPLLSSIQPSSDSPG